MGDFGNNSGLDDVVDNIALEDDDLSLATNAQCTSKVRKYWQFSQGMFPCLQLPFVAGGGDGVASDVSASWTGNDSDGAHESHGRSTHYIPHPTV